MMLLGGLRTEQSSNINLKGYAIVHFLACGFVLLCCGYAHFGYKGHDFKYRSSVKEDLLLLATVYLTFAQVLLAMQSVILRQTSSNQWCPEVLHHPLPSYQRVRLQGNNVYYVYTFFFAMGLVFGVAFVLAILQMRSLALFTYLYGWNFTTADNIFLVFLPFISSFLALSSVVVMVTKTIIFMLDSRPRVDQPNQSPSTMEQLILCISGNQGNATACRRKMQLELSADSIPPADGEVTSKTAIKSTHFHPCKPYDYKLLQNEEKLIDGSTSQHLADLEIVATPCACDQGKTIPEIEVAETS